MTDGRANPAGQEVSKLEDMRAKLMMEARNRKERAEMGKREAVLRYVGKLSQVRSATK